MGGKMNLRQLKYFVEVAESGTISEAARRLYMTQPPITTQIHSLEEELGIQLFERTPRRMTLTDAGKILYSRAGVMLDIIDIAKDEIRSLEEQKTGKIRIGVTSSVFCSDVFDRILKYMKNNKCIDMDIHEANTYDIIEQLRSGTIHTAIARTPFPLNDFRCIIASEGRIKAYGTASMLADMESVTLKQLADEPLIVSRRWHDIITDSFVREGLAYNIKCIADDVRTCMAVAEAGGGISLIPTGDGQKAAHGMVYREVGDMWRSDIVVLYNDNAYMPESVRNFIDCII